MVIHILPEIVSSQIAAGEVISRPSAVVKELLENALDAGARSVTVTLQGSGQPLMEVLDDGSGIAGEDLDLAVARFATSKLETADDLLAIQSLGFRGEALASIGSVSHLTVTTATSDSTPGSGIRVDGGKVGERFLAARSRGTTVRVEDLFYNVPARSKFLKKDVTEKNATLHLLTRYSLAYPALRLKVVQDGRTIYQSSGTGDRREVLSGIYGPETARELLPLDSQAAGMQVSGYISPGHLTRSNRREITFFVNGRWVQDGTLSSALLQGYRNILMVGRYPLAVVFLQLDPAEVDVNVHPAKAEVRFRHTDRVFAALQGAVRSGLQADSALPSLLPASDPWQGSQAGRSLDPAWEMPRSSDSPTQPPPLPGFATAAASGNGGEIGEGPLPVLRLVGQVGAAYLVAEASDGIVLIDQHAAHERVLFEQYARMQGSPLSLQRLLEPVAVQLTPGQAALLSDQLELLGQAGFEVEAFGRDTFLVRSIPALFERLSPETALRVLVEDFEEDEAPLQQEREARMVARICKRAAVKAGQVLTAQEQQKLLTGLLSCFSPRTCPHGRPTMVQLSAALIERQFGRRGAR